MSDLHVNICRIANDNTTLTILGDFTLLCTICRTEKTPRSRQLTTSYSLSALNTLSKCYNAARSHRKAILVVGEEAPFSRQQWRTELFHGMFVEEENISTFVLPQGLRDALRTSLGATLHSLLLPNDQPFSNVASMVGSLAHRTLGMIPGKVDLTAPDPLAALTANADLVLPLTGVVNKEGDVHLAPWSCTLNEAVDDPKQMTLLNLSYGVITRTPFRNVEPEVSHTLTDFPKPTNVELPRVQHMVMAFGLRHELRLLAGRNDLDEFNSHGGIGPVWLNAVGPYVTVDSHMMMWFAECLRLGYTRLSTIAQLIDVFSSVERGDTIVDVELAPGRECIDVLVRGELVGRIRPIRL